MERRASAGVEIELLKVAHENLAPLLGTTLAVGLGAALILSSAGLTWAWAWYAALLALTLVRFVAGGLRQNCNLSSQSERGRSCWRRKFAIGLYASAALWSVPAFLTIGSAPSVHYPMAIVVSALAAGGSGIMASLLTEGRVYISMMLAPASLLLFRGVENGAVLTVLGFVFLAVMLVVHRRNHLVLRRSIELQLENEDLVASLSTLNAQLEDKVAERTRALADAANTDALTGLPNRRGLMAWMRTHLDTSANTSAAVLFLDLDRFKQVNDAMGHEVGDQVLRATAQRLEACVPDNSMLARWGGDEFVVVIGERPDLEHVAQELAHDLIEAITPSFDIDGQNASLGLSVGISLFPKDAQDHRGLILAADLAVAEVKRNGRGQVFSFRHAFAETQKRRFDLGRALGAAIEVHQLELHFQPIVDSRSTRVHAYEALARWRHPELGQISPDEFIRLAEETDRIVALGDWILRDACAAAAAWVFPYSAPKVAVNVSVKQLHDPGFALRVVQILAETGLPPERLELEVTETLFEDEHLEAARRTLEHLREIGVAVVIDDFGTGYSSLSRLQSLPVSAVKIDKSFVADLQGRGGVIIESTVTIARSLGLAVVAEGVETPSQAEALRAMGVDHLQGYYFGRPMQVATPVEAGASRRVAAAAH